MYYPFYLLVMPFQNLNLPAKYQFLSCANMKIPKNSVKPIILVTDAIFMYRIAPSDISGSSLYIHPFPTSKLSSG